MSIEKQTDKQDFSNHNIKRRNQYKDQTWMRKTFTDIGDLKFKFYLLIIFGIVCLILGVFYAF